MTAVSRCVQGNTSAPRTAANMSYRYYNDIDFYLGPLQNFRRATFSEFARTNPQALRGHRLEGLRRRLALNTFCRCDDDRTGQETENAETWPGCLLKDGDCSFLKALKPHDQIPVQLNEVPWSLVAKAAYVPWCCTEPYTCYPNHLAALFGRKDLYQEKAADVNARDSRGNTTLMLAAASGFAMTMVPFLLDMCKDEDDRKMFVTASNNDGLTALHFAVLSDDVKVVQLLVDMGADLNAGQFTTLQNQRFALSPLHFALVKGTRAAAGIVEFLVESGADASLEAATVDSTAPCAMFVSECPCGLCWSQVLHGLPKLLLPSSGAQYHGRIKSVGTALHLAVKRGLDQAAWYILWENQHKMLVNVPDGSGYLPLLTAARNLDHYAVKMLLSFGADINAQVAGDGLVSGKTALHLAFSFDIDSTMFRCSSCHRKVPLESRLEHCVTLLLEQPSVNVDARDCRGQTPLHMACKYGHHAFIEQLVVSGASVLATDHNDRSPLSFASGPRDRAVREKIVDVLLRCGAAPSFQSGPIFATYSPLHLIYARRDVATFLKMYRLGTFSSYTLNKRLSVIMSVVSGNGPVGEEEERNEVFAAAKAAYKPNGCNPRSLYSQSIICVARQIRPGTPHSRREAFKSLELDPITLTIIEGLCLM